MSVRATERMRASLDALTRVYTNDSKPDFARRVSFTTVREDTRSRFERDAARLERAVHRLAQAHPCMSARDLDTSIAPALLAVLAMLAVATFATPGPALFVGALFGAVFAACVLARLAVAMGFDRGRRAAEIAWTPPPVGDEAPFYTVLVALHDEASEVPDLVAALDRLDWPREKLEIVLVCEADDDATLDAIRAHGLPEVFEVVAVPPAEPRTKPKALAYALPQTVGDIVVLYDAEDRPGPLQLREASDAFRRGGPDLACLQAPLYIDNHGEGVLPAIFAAEYSALFDALLPTLAQCGGPVPLGGTSNHFIRRHLDRAGGWDPFNVTEDADLGLRLARMGLRVGTLARATDEEAPVELRPWITQRTRWFKGWLQTLLVHSRRPLGLWRDLGPRGFALFHIFVTGMVLSALVHPFMLLGLVWHGSHVAMTGWSGADGATRVLLGIAVASIVLGYGAFIGMAWRTLPLRGLTGVRRALWGVPLYWVLMSCAAWRAVWQLHAAPSLWEKTPHGRSRRPAEARS